ncbi:MAG: hypothetical protein K0S47_4429 [Herbinix sp.]|nr:hypothetical protein [Herbinix sp.]
MGANQTRAGEMFGEEKSGITDTNVEVIADLSRLNCLD